MHKAKYVHNRKLQIWGPHVDIAVIYNTFVTGEEVVKVTLCLHGYLLFIP